MSMIRLSLVALAGATGFALVNGAGADMSGVAIRRTGSQDWRPLTIAPRSGSRGAVDFTDPDCAFDIRADLAGRGTATWAGVNLCETSAVTLHYDDSGAAWAEYE
jgi:hypothetical protein